MNVVAIVQARMGSTRLPGKVMMDLGGKPVLAWVVEAAQKAKLVNEVWVATDHKSPQVVDWCAKKCFCFLGDEDNVLSRFKAIARMTEADLIVRLTADCPMVTPEIIDACIEIKGASTEEWPDGLDVQVITPALLEVGDKEHVVPLNHALPQLPNPNGNMRLHVRLTVDTQEDLDTLRAFIA